MFVHEPRNIQDDTKQEEMLSALFRMFRGAFIDNHFHFRISASISNLRSQNSDFQPKSQALIVV
jgi:hypothetical protein